MVEQDCSGAGKSKVERSEQSLTLTSRRSVNTMPRIWSGKEVENCDVVDIAAGRQDGKVFLESQKLRAVSESERPLPLILDRTSLTSEEKERPRGSVMEGVCPRRGAVELWSMDLRRVVIPTTCKTWKCVVCARKMKALFCSRVEIGVSRLGRCAFITGTYQADSPRLRDAGCVRKDWMALLRRLDRSAWQDEWKRMKWLRVMELTRRGIPHFHLVIGPVGDFIRCHGDSMDIRKFRSRMEDCDCLSHRFSREWKAITKGESYIWFAIPVAGAAKAGSYMAKYLDKAFDGKRAGELGMKRRWSYSKGWPGGGRLRLAMSKDAGGPGWRWTQFYKGVDKDYDVESGPNDPELMERHGEDMTLALSEKHVRRTRARKVLNVANVREENGTVVDGSRPG